MSGEARLFMSETVMLMILKKKKKAFNFNSLVTQRIFPLSSALFPDVVNCMQTDNLELKKLVYLYLMNYAKSQPDMAIMAVNTFVKVSKGNTPIVQIRKT